MLVIVKLQFAVEFLFTCFSFAFQGSEIVGTVFNHIRINFAYLYVCVFAFAVLPCQTDIGIEEAGKPPWIEPVVEFTSQTLQFYER